MLACLMSLLEIFFSVLRGSAVYMDSTQTPNAGVFMVMGHPYLHSAFPLMADLMGLFDIIIRRTF
jgi:hypothetical protein